MRRIALQGAKRLEKINQASPAYNVSRTYLGLMGRRSMPWSVATEDSLVSTKAEAVLDEDHYNLKKGQGADLRSFGVRS